MAAKFEYSNYLDIIKSPWIDFGRGMVSSLEFLEREWLVTNGIGGYACGTVAGMLTRRYHGLLVAALSPPLKRTLLLTKVDETIEYGGVQYRLFVNRWSDDRVDPRGFDYLERFHLEGTTPVWTYAIGEALLEKRVWMQTAQNTTYIQYSLKSTPRPALISVNFVANKRSHHGISVGRNWLPQTRTTSSGLELRFPEDVHLYLSSASGSFTPEEEWQRSYYLSIEKYRGLDYLDDHLVVAKFIATLQPGKTLTLIASTNSDTMLDGAAAYQERVRYERTLLEQAFLEHVGLPDNNNARTTFPALSQLVLAADQFLVHRPTQFDQRGYTVIAGYPWFSDWGRDTMISLPGLTLSSNRPDIARSVLMTFAQFVDKGMLPNRFPSAESSPEYNSVDATLWFFEAIHTYYVYTKDDAFIKQIFPILQDIIYWFRNSTRYNIMLDSKDGLLYAGEKGVQLTWMDVKIGDWVVTPRTGKPVEINSLWYNALRIMEGFSQICDRSPGEYRNIAECTHKNFSRYWNADLGYLYDVLDTPDGTEDTSLRPNQIFAVSLPHSPIDKIRQKAVVDICERDLYTPFGLRSLSPSHSSYAGNYGGDQRQRDSVYHQGTVWAWLIGPFVKAHFRVYGDRDRAMDLLMPLIRHLKDGCVGNMGEIFEGDPPFKSRGCFAQAWSVAQLLQILREIIG